MAWFAIILEPRLLIMYILTVNESLENHPKDRSLRALSGPTLRSEQLGNQLVMSMPSYKPPLWYVADRSICELRADCH